MTELLILAVLVKEKNTIYGIRQKIKDIFSIFFLISFGSIHPTLKKLHENRFVTVKTKLSSGGQKSSVYSITPSGIERFKSLMLDDLPENPSQSAQLINIKLMLLSYVDKDLQNIVINKILKNLETQKICIQQLLKNNDKIQEKLLRRVFDKILEDILWIKTLV